MASSKCILAMVLSAVLFQFEPTTGFYCPGSNPASLRQEAKDKNCKFVVVGRLENAINDPDSPSTDLVIDRILKNDPYLNGTKAIRIPKNIPKEDGKLPPCYLLFGDFDRGKIHPYRGKPVSAAFLRYFNGVLDVDDKDTSKLLNYIIDQWDEKDKCIIDEILIELAHIDWNSLQRTASSIPSEKLRKRLSDQDAAIDTRLVTAAVLLGYQGQKNDLPLFRSQIARSSKNTDAIKAILFGAILVSPQEGWVDLKKMIGNTELPFYSQFACLRVLELIHQQRIAQIPEGDWLEAVARIVNDKDMSDLAIETLRKIKCWKLTDQVVALERRSEFVSPMIRRSMLRYCMQCPDASGKVYVEEMRKAKPDVVEDVEESLKYEAIEAGGKR